MKKTNINKKINFNYISERIKYISNSKVQEFLKLFVVCEYLYKTLVKLEQSSTREDEIKIHLSTAHKVFKKIGYNNYDVLMIIFGSKSDSYKNIRNAIVHSISRKNSLKVIENHGQFLSTMNDFIENIKLIAK